MSFEPTVGMIVGIVEVYYWFWDEVRKERPGKRVKVLRGKCRAG